MNKAYFRFSEQDRGLIEAKDFETSELGLEMLSCPLCREPVVFVGWCSTSIKKHFRHLNGTCSCGG